MRPPRLLIAVAATALIAGTTAAMLGEDGFIGTAYEPPQSAPAFSLTDHRGQSVELRDYRGKALLVFFGFTSCPDVCPLTLRKLDRVLDGMHADTSDVRVLLVTVDPQRDTPSALATYLEAFGPHVVGLTGDSAALASMRSEYGVYAGPHPAGHEVEITHTPAVFGIDGDGNLRVLLPMEEPDERIASDIRKLM